MHKTADRTLLVSALLLASLLVTGGFISFAKIQELNEHSQWVSHTHEILDLSGQLLRSMVDADTGMRGFVVTGDETFLAPYSETIASITAVTNRLSDATRDHFTQHERVQKLAELNEAGLALLKQIIELRRNDAGAARSLMATRKIKNQIDAIRNMVDEFEQEERHLLIMRKEQTAAAFRSGVSFIIINVLLGLAGVGAFVSMLRRKVMGKLRIAEAQREGQERLAGVVESAMDGVISIDNEQRILVFNTSAEGIFGYSAAQVLGQRVEMLIPERFRLAHEDNVRRFGAIGATSRQMGNLSTIYGVRSNGDEFPLEASISQTVIQGKKIFTVILRDVSERNKADLQLRSAFEELAASNRELEQFAYVASHDLQEPLRAISGCVQILHKRMQGKLDATAEELIVHATEGVGRMQTLINDLLSYSRITTRGKEIADTSAVAALSNSLKNLYVAVHESAAIITADELPMVRADATQLTQLFQNLIGNAIKFCRERPPRVQIGVKEDSGYWVFSVRDNGIGIDPEYFDRIFAVFQRLHTRTEYPGTGIGLAICKKIVERHGGRIWVESAPGQGSTFFFALPISGCRVR